MSSWPLLESAGKWLFKRTSLSNRLCSGGGDTSPFTCDPAEIVLGFLSHLRGSSSGGLWDEDFKAQSCSPAFLSPLSKELWEPYPPLEFMDWWAQLHLWQQNLHGEPRAKMKAGFKSFLHMCCSSIEEMSWWELIPVLEEILGVSKMILIHAVDPNHPLPRDQLVGEC